MDIKSESKNNSKLNITESGSITFNPFKYIAFVIASSNLKDAKNYNDATSRPIQLNIDLIYNSAKQSAKTPHVSAPAVLVTRSKKI